MGISLEQLIKSKESKKFFNFFDIIQQEAKEKSCLFFVDCGEGNSFETEEMEMEDLSGWLIPEKEAEDFITNWQKNNNADHLSKWGDCFRFAKWTIKDNKVNIEFKNYTD